MSHSVPASFPGGTVVAGGFCAPPARRWLALLLLGATLACEAAQVPTAPAIEAGRDALRRSGNYPWYDRAKDRLRRVDAVPDRQSASVHRGSDWESLPRQPRNWSPAGWGSVLSAALKVTFWIFIAAILGALVWVLIRVFLNLESRQASDSPTTHVQDSRSDVDRVESLPFPVRRPRSDLLSEAQRQYEAGHYREAMIYQFSYMLLHLDRRHLIHLAKGKTNRQYLWEIRSRAGLFQLLEHAMIAFEDVFFGDHDLKQSEFEERWHRLDEFHRLVNEGAAP